jgi:hypothetical protein
MWKGCVLGVFATVAACSADAPGLAVEVTSTTPISSIEVFLGQQKCMGPDGAGCAITPPDMTAALRTNAGGGAWYRDGEPVFRGDATGSATWFRIEPTGSASVVQLIAVGLDANGVPVASGILHDLAIPADKTTYLPLTLVGSGSVDATTEAKLPHDDGDFVRIWNNDTSDCVVTEHWAAGKATRSFIVPRADADCDGFATANPLECDPLWSHRSTDTASVEQARCVTAKTFSVPGVSTCMLGGPPCVDGAGPDLATCVPVDPTYCVPTPLCDPQCASEPLPTCFGHFSTSQLHCTIYADVAGTPCSTAIIASPQSGTTTGVAALLGTSTTKWKDVELGDAIAWNMLAPMTAWALPAPSTAKLHAVPSAMTPGELDLSWTGVPVAGPGYSASQWGLADLTLSNDRHMLIPLRIGYGSCTQGNTRSMGIDCYLTLGNADGVTACAN